MRRLLLATILPALAFAAPPPTQSRTSVLLIPMDQGAEASAVKLEAYMVEALEAFPAAKVKKSDELFGLPGDEEAEASLRRAEKGYAESRRAFEAKEYEDAERKLRATLKEYQRAAGALKACDHYCDAIAMYAAVMQKRGDTEEAKLALLDLIALSPTYEIDVKRMGRELVSLRSQVATSRSAQFRGSAIIRTRPSGARVYLDGEFKGYSPVTIHTLPVGKHLLAVERPGFYRHGQVIEVTPDDVEVAAELEPTKQWKAWDGQMDKVAADAAKGQGASLSQVGRMLALDRALIGTLKEVSDQGTEVSLGVFDLRTGKQLASRRAVYQGDEYGQLKNEVGRLVTALLNSVDRPKEVPRSSDPLDHTSGMEEWSGEDRGGRNQKVDSSGDPLDSISGMEDW